MTRRGPALAGVLLSGILGTVVTASPALAHWAATGAGAGWATTAALNAPTNPLAVLSAPATVDVAWTAPTGVAPDGYYVTRIDESDGSSALACGSSPTVLVAGPCTDTPSTGSFHYTVTAVLASWSATSGTSNTLTWDGAAPTVVGVSSPQADGTYRTPGTVIAVTVTFDGPVTVTGAPRLLLATGSPATTAIPYDSGSGTAVLTFRYTIVDGNSSADLDYASTGALVPNGGSITDTFGNPAVLTLPGPGAPGSLGASTALIIDTSPIVTVTSVNGSPVTFPHTVRNPVSSIGGTCGVEPGDSPTVRPLIDGAANSPATVPCAAGSWTLTFAVRLTAEAILALSATQTDVVGNTGTAPEQVLTIDRRRPGIELGAVAQAAPSSGRASETTEVATTQPDAGASDGGSDGGSHSPQVDRTAPVALSVERAGPEEVVKAGPLEWLVTFSEPVAGVDAGTFEVVASGVEGRPALAEVAPLGSEPSARWTVAVDTTGVSGSDLGSIGLDLGGVSGVQDSAGNALGPGPLVGEAYRYDTTPPEIVVTRIEGVWAPEPGIIVSGTADPDEGPVTVHLCRGSADCDTASAAEVVDGIPVAADGVWHVTIPVDGPSLDWYAIGGQSDLAGNVGLSDVWGPLAD